MGQSDTTKNLIPWKSADGWHGLVWRGWEEEFGQVDAWLSSHPGECVVEKPNRTVRRVELPRGLVYVKEIRRLADGRHFWRDILKRIRWYLRPSRAIKVARISAAMLQKGVGCPKPLLSVRRRDVWGVPHDVMISEGLPFPTVSNLIVAAESESSLKSLLEPVVSDLARIHGLGFVHGDGMPGNMLWDGKQLFFIDNDRTILTNGRCLREGRCRNLIQFWRGLAWESHSLEQGLWLIEFYNKVSSPEYFITRPMYCSMRKKVCQSLEHVIAKRNIENWLSR